MPSRACCFKIAMARSRTVDLAFCLLGFTNLGGCRDIIRIIGLADKLQSWAIESSMNFFVLDTSTSPRSTQYQKRYRTISYLYECKTKRTSMSANTWCATTPFTKNQSNKEKNPRTSGGRTFGHTNIIKLTTNICTTMTIVLGTTMITAIRNLENAYWKNPPPTRHCTLN